MLRGVLLLTWTMAASAVMPTYVIKDEARRASHMATRAAQLGPRPKYLVDDMKDSDLKTALQKCISDEKQSFLPHDFSIGEQTDFDQVDTFED